MLPIDFKGRNRILHGPRDEQGNPTTDILNLPSFTNGRYCISCWELNDEEKRDLQASKALWIHLCCPINVEMHISMLHPIRGYSIIVETTLLDVLYQDEERSITCWPLTDDEIELVQTTGVIWFTIRSGHTQPPVGFFTRSPFINQ
ncbi:hypothetical protein [Spirosoma oryzicola]|uniref:hypothetical protein n=1 Tax=Spirosoma oryzicola TaxID=2898794 RepID=UPI001E3A340E|nr:hypothetical protein [Spirosoma oryzicola]UHG91783.1 hypothetical protein LQ777_02530 [Spirosoma oryzicola]